MTDYKKKYLKYKLKYLQLKNLKKNLQLKNTNNLVGGVKTFKTKKNDGSNGNIGYSNQCMWLSIIDYLNGVLGYNFTLEEIREFASGSGTKPINGKLEEFDADLHMDSLNTITDLFDLQIHIYPLLRGRNIQGIVISDEPIQILGKYSASNVISIVSYGNHFALITSIGGIKLYGGRIQSSDEFVPNTKLTLGKQTDKLKEINDKQLQILDELLNESVNLERIKNNLEEDSKKIKRELEELEITTFTPELRNTDDELLKGILLSYEDIKAKLDEKKRQCDNEIEVIRQILSDINEQINLIIM